MPDEPITLLSLVRWSPLHLLIAATIAQRVWELRRARRNEKRLLAKGAVEHGRDHYPAIVTLHTLWFAAMIAEIVILTRSINPFWPAILLLWLLAQALRVWTLRTLGRRWTARVLVLRNEKPVTTGPYRYLRHPNYLVVAAEILLLPLMFNCLITAVTFTVMNAILLGVRMRVEGRAWREVRGA